jgi:flavin-dependent dehydrogenase
MEAGLGARRLDAMLPVPAAVRSLGAKVTIPALPADRGARCPTRSGMIATPAYDSDCIVIGGGPAGSTAACVLAQRGRRVRLLERDVHPRFHIGESLLPANLPVLERLGVLPRVEQLGVRKLAADFPSGERDYGSFAFGRALAPIRDHAFQVRRSEFDQLLFERAAELGAQTCQGCEVLQVERGADGLQRVQVREDGAERELRARYVIDASGRDTLFGRQLKLKQANTRHRSAALFGHFRGVERRPGEAAGNITIYRVPRGWLWMIPLRDDVMSVGAVCDPEHFRSRQGDLDRFLLDTVAANPRARQRMAGAVAVSPAEATGNYSYQCRAIGGPGWVMAGDAYAFVDPIFSSGVFLAMHSAEQAAALVDAVLDAPAREAALQHAYRRRLDAGLRTFTWFIERFTTPTMRHLFAHPSNRWQVEQSVISLLAGDVFDNRPVQRRLRVFRLIYAATRLLRWLRGDERGVAAAAPESAAA